MRLNRVFLRVLMLFSCALAVTSLIVDETLSQTSQKIARGLKFGPRKSDTLVGKFMNDRNPRNGREKSEPNISQSDKNICQDNCLKCSSTVDCTLCQNGYESIKNICVKILNDNKQADAQQGLLKSQPNKGISWILWVIIGLVVAGVVFFVIMRCKKQENDDMYHNPNNHENRLFEMTRRDQPTPKKHVSGPNPVILVHKPIEETTIQSHQMEKIENSEIIDKKRYGNSSPMSSKIDESLPITQLGAINPHTSVPGFDSFIAGNSPQPLKVIGLPSEEVTATPKTEEIAEIPLEGSFNMTKKVQPTELRPKDITQTTRIAEFNPLYESEVIDSKKTSPNLRSPKGNTTIKPLNSNIELNGEAVTSQLFASNIVQRPKN